MRYGQAIDMIARDLGIPEEKLVEYIKSEGIDKQLARRPWKWKADKPRRRRMHV